MKYLHRVSQWTAVVTALFLVSSLTHRLEADPTADFSFSLSHPRGPQEVASMSHRQVKGILADHLDVFPKSQLDKLTRHLIEVCKKHQFDPALVLSVMRVESSFRIRAKSPVGALGLMQLMPPTADYVARKYGIRYTGERSLLDPYTNISLGVAYLAHLRERYRSDSPYFQFAAYNMGPGRLEQLRSRRGDNFRATKTKDYYEAIRRNVPALRAYRKGSKLRQGA